jgi:DMSO reductase family type II enzyme chaperone
MRREPTSDAGVDTDTEGNDDGPTADDPEWTESLDVDAAARGGLYGLLARAFGDPNETLHRAFRTGEFRREVERLLDRTSIDPPVPAFETGDDHDTLCARYNDLFVLTYSEVADPTDGSVDSTGPTVPLYESDYRTEVSWNDVNLDLARAYDYFGLSVDTENRENHDHLRLELEFAGYLCRREAAVDASAGQARLDFLDRHLSVLAGGVRGRLGEEPGTDVYADLVTFLDDFVDAETADLAARREEGEGRR